MHDGARHRSWQPTTNERVKPRGTAKARMRSPTEARRRNGNKRRSTKMSEPVQVRKRGGLKEAEQRRIAAQGAHGAAAVGELG